VLSLRLCRLPTITLIPAYLLQNQTDAFEGGNILMKRSAFLRIFWGLLFVALDIRLSSIDFLLPDFIGYILIVSGLNLLTSEHQWFRRARLFAIIMIFVSLTSFIEIKVDSTQVQRLRREWISFLTSDLNALFPQQVGSARLLQTTNSRSTIDDNRNQNPQREEDVMLGEYSDGTVVLILRYASPEEAYLAMALKTEKDYSDEGLQKRAQTNPSFELQNWSESHGGSFHNQVKVSAYSNVKVADRIIQQWWNRGWNWRAPTSWQEKGGWNDSTLYIVEGYQASADAYKAAFAGSSPSREGVKLDPLFPVSLLGEILNTLLIWGICSGIIALSLSSNNCDLMESAKRRRNFYIVLSVLGWTLPISWLIAPEFASGLVTAGAPVLMVYAFALMISMLFLMGLMRKTANFLEMEPIPQE
jgi:hypothetical protein